MTFRQFAYRNVVRNSRIYGAFSWRAFFCGCIFIYSMLMFHPDIERGILGEMSLIGMVGLKLFWSSSHYSFILFHECLFRGQIT